MCTRLADVNGYAWIVVMELLVDPSYVVARSVLGGVFRIIELLAIVVRTGVDRSIVVLGAA